MDATVLANFYVFIVKTAQYMSNDPTKIRWTKKPTLYFIKSLLK